MISELNQQSQKNLISVELVSWHQHLLGASAGKWDAFDHQQIPLEPGDVFVGVVGLAFDDPEQVSLAMSDRSATPAFQRDLELASACFAGRRVPRVHFFRHKRAISIHEIAIEKFPAVERVHRFFAGLSRTDPDVVHTFQSSGEFRAQIQALLGRDLDEYQKHLSTVTPEPGGPVGLLNWLKFVRLSRNPFADHNANSGEHLAEYYSDKAPYFDEIVGTLPNRPQTMIVFGNPGTGKTVMCQMIERFAKDSINGRRILTVSLTDYAELARLSDMSDPVSRQRAVVEHLIALGVQELSVAVVNSWAAVRPEATIEQRRELWRYVHAYGGRAGDVQSIFTSALKSSRAPSAAAGDEFTPYEQAVERLARYSLPDMRRNDVYAYQSRLAENITSVRLNGDSEQLRSTRNEIVGRLNNLAHSALGVSFHDLVSMEASGLAEIFLSTLSQTAGLGGSPRDLLHGFCKACRTLGFDCVYFLIDRIDEASFILPNPQAQAALLLPLLLDPTLIQADDGLLAFRFFLPESFRPLLEAAEVRLASLKARSISDWSPDALRTLIRRRLETCSLPGKRPFSWLAELSTVHDLDEQLIAAAGGNPRRLIQLCDELIAEHCNSTITSDHVQIPQEALTRLLARLPPPSQPVARPTAAADPQPATPHQPSTEDLAALLPTPIAAAYVEYQNGGQVIHEKTLRAISLLQVTVQFVGCVLLALCKRTGAPDPTLDEALRKSLFDPHRAPSLGAWWSTIGVMVRQSPALGGPIGDAFALFHQPEVKSTVSELIQLRNNVTHRQTFAPDTVRDIAQRLERLLRALGPIGHLTVGSVERHEVNRRRELIHYIRRYRGNVLSPHIGQVRFADQAQGPYPTGRVLLYDDDARDAIDLSPFIVVDANKNICLYEMLKPGAQGRLEIEYIDTRSSRTFRTDEDTDTLRGLGLIA